MIVCPLCEHAQAGGFECEVCGRLLADAGGLAAEAPPLDGLEPTLAPPVAVPEAAALPDLEPTGQPGVAAPAAAPLPDLEPTLAAPVGVDVLEGPPVPELERASEAIPDEERTPYPAVVRCRYCGTEGGLGERLCSRCGMRLPLPDAFPTGATVEGAVRCGCGALVQGSRCPACGARRAG